MRDFGAERLMGSGFGAFGAEMGFAQMLNGLWRLGFGVLRMGGNCGFWGDRVILKELRAIAPRKLHSVKVSIGSRLNSSNPSLGIETRKTIAP